MIRKPGRPTGKAMTLRATPQIVMVAEQRIADAALVREIAAAKREAAQAPLFRQTSDEIDKFLNR